MTGRRVLLVEDDLRTREMVELYLRREGHEVIAAADGLSALELADQHEPHLVILDLMLPGLDGLEVARLLRERRPVPIIMVTARAAEDDKLTGLDQGADDYVVKPFSPRELMARVRAVLRRAAEEDVIALGGIEIDRQKHEVKVEGRPVPLTPAEFRLLETMIRLPGRTFTREELLERVFGGETESFDRTIDAHVMKLRRKLGDAGQSIVTVFGIGYKFGS